VLYVGLDYADEYSYANGNNAPNMTWLLTRCTKERAAELK